MAKKTRSAIDCRRLDLDGIRYVILRESAFDDLCEKAGVCPSQRPRTGRRRAPSIWTRYRSRKSSCGAQGRRTVAGGTRAACRGPPGNPESHRTRPHDARFRYRAQAGSRHGRCRTRTHYRFPSINQLLEGPDKTSCGAAISAAFRAGKTPAPQVDLGPVRSHHAGEHQSVE